MSDRQMLHHEDKINVSFNGIKDCLNTFHTKKEAISAGSAYGWMDAIKCVDRFEYFWVVGRLMFQPSYAAGIMQDCFKFPLLRWDKKDGVEFCPVLEVKRISK